MLNRLRARLSPYFDALGRGGARAIPSPTGWTLLGFAFALLAAFAFLTGGRSGELVGGLGILASGFFDIVDGAVARAVGRVTKKGAFLDSTLDRVAELALFVGVLEGGFAPPVVVVLALSLSLLVSYARARGESLGADLAGVGVGERSERLLVLAVSAILGLTLYGTYLVALLAGVTFAERVYRASAAL